MVLNVESEAKQKTATYYLERWIKSVQLKTMIDTSSPVTIFAVDEIENIMGRKDPQIRRMVEGEKNADFKGKPPTPLELRDLSVATG